MKLFRTIVLVGIAIMLVIMGLFAISGNAYAATIVYQTSSTSQASFTNTNPLVDVCNGATVTGTVSVTQTFTQYDDGTFVVNFLVQPTKGGLQGSNGATYSYTVNATQTISPVTGFTWTTTIDLVPRQSGSLGLKTEHIYRDQSNPFATPTCSGGNA